MSDLDDPTQRELKALRERLEVLEARLRHRPSRRPKVTAAAIAMALVCGAAGVVFAANGNCPNGLPFCFAPDTPAQAGQVNHNFSQLKEWLEAKVGAVTTPAISTAAGLSTTGGLQVNNSNITLTDGRLIGTNPAGNFHIDATGNALYLNWFSGNGVTFGNGAQGQVGRLDNQGNLSVNGRVTVGNTGGNVPFNCVVRTASSVNQVACAANEIAVGGGGRCSYLWRLTESLPWGGASDSDTPVNGQPARAWRSICQVWGSAGTYSTPQLGSYAICCRQ